MTSKFCTNCGSPLDEGASFCTACGASVTDDAPVQGAAQPNPARNGKRVILILAIAAVVVLIAVLIFFLTQCSGSDDSSEPATAASEAPASPSGSDSSADEALSPEKQNALAIYEQMGVLDERISACANEFNENSLKPDRALRERCAQTAAEVYQDAIMLQTSISAMSSGGAKELGEDTSHLRELDNDLVNRIQVIDEAWSRSLEFSDPAAHESYILAPIVADSDGSDNKYYRHFKDNYPNWRPTGS